MRAVTPAITASSGTPSPKSALAPQLRRLLSRRHDPDPLRPYLFEEKLKEECKPASCFFQERIRILERRNDDIHTETLKEPKNETNNSRFSGHWLGFELLLTLRLQEGGLKET